MAISHFEKMLGPFFFLKPSVKFAPRNVSARASRLLNILRTKSVGTSRPPASKYCILITFHCPLRFSQKPPRNPSLQRKGSLWQNHKSKNLTAANFERKLPTNVFKAFSLPLEGVIKGPSCVGRVRARSGFMEHRAAQTWRDRKNHSWSTLSPCFGSTS